APRRDVGYLQVTGGRHETGEDVEKSGLARPVGSDQRHPRSRGDVQVDPVQHLDATAFGAELPARDRRGRGGENIAFHRTPRLRLSTTRKKGAPIAAVTTPIGSSAGDMTVRARTSARTRKDAPTSSD